MCISRTWSDLAIFAGVWYLMFGIFHYTEGESQIMSVTATLICFMCSMNYHISLAITSKKWGSKYKLFMTALHTIIILTSIVSVAFLMTDYDNLIGSMEKLVPSIRTVLPAYILGQLCNCIAFFIVAALPIGVDGKSSASSRIKKKTVSLEHSL